MQFSLPLHGYIFFIVGTWIFFAVSATTLWLALSKVRMQTAKELGIFEYALGMTAIIFVHSIHLSLEAMNFGFLPLYLEPYFSIIFDSLISISALIFVLFALKLRMNTRG